MDAVAVVEHLLLAEMEMVHRKLAEMVEMVQRLVFLERL
jgi:hypothetical protein